MKMCNIEDPCPISGENICCKSCGSLQTCLYVCERAIELAVTCSDEIDEPDAMTVFQAKERVVIKAMTDLLKQKKQLEEREKVVREKLLATMDAYGVKSFENELLKVTYVPVTIRTSIDSKALKKDLPDVAAKYSKTSTVAASVRISLKQ